MPCVSLSRLSIEGDQRRAVEDRIDRTQLLPAEAEEVGGEERVVGRGSFLEWFPAHGGNVGKPPATAPLDPVLAGWARSSGSRIGARVIAGR